MDPRADNSVTLRAPNMMNLDGADHSRLRNLVQQAFTPKSVENFREHLHKIANMCLSSMPEGPVNIVKRLSKPMPTIAVADYIGIDSTRHEDFKRWTDSLTKRGYPVPREDQWSEIVDADTSLRSFLAEVVADRSQNPGDDLVSRLINARDKDQRLSTDEIVEMCFLLIGAGNFTTTDLISNCVYSHLTKTESQALDEASLVSQTLKVDPPVLSIRRNVTEDIDVGGKTIKQGAVVSLLIGAANHDQVNTGTNLSFGRGLHHCLGAPLAKLEAEVAIRCFRERYPDASLISATRSKRMDFRGFNSLIVEPS